MKNHLLGTISIFCLFANCKKQSDTSCSIAKSLYIISNYPIGTALDNLTLNNDSLYRNLFLKQFNSTTPENIFKAVYLHPSINEYHWAEADQFADFCKLNNKRIHGHTLIWHNQNPEWMNTFSGDKMEWIAMMRSHITNIVQHYGASIHSWDVVNEAYNEDGSLRNTIWLQHIGASYIQLAFEFAHQANPNATLFYNDYGLETNPTKRRAVLALIKQLKNNDVPIDGIGLQMHINIKNSPIELIEDAIHDIGINDLKLHLSELDIAINPYNLDYQVQQQDLQCQANLLFRIVRAYNQLPNHLQFGITFWGICDHYSWIRTYYNRQDYPLLFDEQYGTKPVFCKLQQSL